MGDILLANEVTPGTPSSGQTIVFVDSTLKRLSTKNDAGIVTNYPMGIANASAVGASGAFAVDTYLTGSALTIPVAGDWTLNESARWRFDMTKTGAGVAAFTITVRMGTAGTTSDPAILTLAYGAGTAAIDTGWFDVWVTFQSVGGGTSAVLAGVTRCTHHLAATGLTQTGASGVGIITGVSAGFNSTTQTIIGLSLNGGASFSGTNVLVQTELRK